MENFFIDEEFYSDLGDYIDEIGEDEVPALEDDWSIEANESSHEHLFELSTDWIMKRIDDDRFPEEGTQYDRIAKLLDSKINYAEINAAIPTLYYQTKKKFVITKADLLEYLNP